ncbi:MAG TPA: hypothetical protein VLC74_12650 [Rhizomicrobium sp.]|nr:hypothetical protein [Rhizomicrobium sp.]
MYRSILFSAAAIALMAGSVSAQASCGASLWAKGGVLKQMPHIKMSPREAAPDGYGSIVGMWNNSVIVGGNVVVSSIATWHSDGTEFDNVDFPPITGNICQGVWESKGVGKVVEHHLGWTFDQNSNPTGYFTLEQTLKLSHDGMSYGGPFDQKFYDVNGNLVNEIAGDMSATRFTGN